MILQGLTQSQTLSHFKGWGEEAAPTGTSQVGRRAVLYPR